MANYVPVRKEQLQNVKLAKTRNLELLKDQHLIPLTAAEYAQGSASYPIIFVKSPEETRYRSIAMLGLEAGENLFYKDKVWSALSLPHSASLTPFALGLDPDEENTLTACIDLDSEFVGEDKDLALFEEDGKESELLVNVQTSLGRLYENEKRTENFIKLLTEHELIHEIELVINFASGEKKKLTGIHTVDEEKLQKLSDETVLDFHKRGIFVAIHSMLSSLTQINRLVQLRNDSGKNKVAGIQVVEIAKEQAKAKAEASAK